MQHDFLHAASLILQFQIEHSKIDPDRFLCPSRTGNLNGSNFVAEFNRSTPPTLKTIGCKWGSDPQDRDLFAVFLKVQDMQIWLCKPDKARSISHPFFPRYERLEHSIVFFKTLEEAEGCANETNELYGWDQKLISPHDA